MKEVEIFLKLLQVAIDNGFDITNLPTHFELWINDSNSAHLKVNGNKNIQIVDNTILVLGSITYAIDKLVLDWEEGEISFIDALAIASKNFEITSCAKYPMSVRQQWTLQPTSKRLNWLFETFKHLL